MQYISLLLFFIGTLIGGGVVAWYQYTPAQNPSTYPEQTEAHAQPTGAQAGHMAQMQQMLVTSEKSFITRMIPHHQEAIDTANEVLERGGTTEEIRELTNNIITTQTTEIESMRKWHERWYGESYQDNTAYTPMMRDLADLSGKDIDRAFLEDMTMHHMGAIMMARSIQPYIEHSEMTELTENIVTTQSAEITQMRAMLQEM